MANTGQHKPDCIDGMIEFRNVSFVYPSRGDQKIMDNFNLKVLPGEMVALVGPSGGGKSTAVRLIERLYDPDSGAIYLDGVDLKDYDSRVLHQRCLSIVSQVPLFSPLSVL